VAAVVDELGELSGEAIGVGPIVSAVNAAFLLGRARPSRIVLVGTAGRYSGGPAIGSAVVASVAGWSDGASELGLAYVPLAPPPISLDPIGLQSARVLTVPGITTDPGLARRFGERWDVEHLETFGVALACARAGVPFAAVLGITNDVGPDAHAQWVANRRSAEEAARTVARAILSA
jgi:purine-nucleoside phosphorylase